MSVSHYQLIHAQFPDANFDGDVSNFVAKIRLYKTPEEIKQLQAAGREADFAFQIGLMRLKTV